MRISVKMVCLTVCMFLMCACGAVFDSRKADLLKSATIEDYGPPPPENHHEIEMRMIASLLKDPNSAQVESGGIRRDIIPSDLASPKPVLVWVTDLGVNAKNGFGGYTGMKPYYFAWSNGEIIAVGLPDTTRYGSVYYSWEYLR